MTWRVHGNEDLEHEMKRFLTASILLLSLLGVYACATEVDQENERVAAVTQSILEGGLKCPQLMALSKMSDSEAQLVRQGVQDVVGLEALLVMADESEKCDVQGNAGQAAAEGVGLAVQAITGTYKVEQIEEQNSASAGWSPTYIRTDGSSYGYMCGSQYEWPKDYIAEFLGVTNAYSSPSTLRVMGLTSYGQCYIPGYLMARVYSDNDIRACVGYVHVWVCGGPMQTTDLRVYHN